MLGSLSEYVLVCVASDDCPHPEAGFTLPQSLSFGIPSPSHA